MSSFPPWTNNTTYTIGDGVTYLGVVYSCLITNIDILPTNATYWVLNASANQTIVAGTGIAVTGGSEPVVTVATNLSAGSNITLTPSGNNITIASGSGGVLSVTGGTNINITGSSGQFPTVNLNNALTDSSSSTGAGNQVLSAGTSGNTLLWVNESSGLSSGTGISIADNIYNQAVITNTGVTSLTAGTGLSGNATSGDITLSNTGVTSLTAGTGIGVSGSTGSVTISNTGVTSISGGRNINISSGNTINLNSSLLDSASSPSTGSQNQILTAGSSGNSLLWGNPSSVIVSGGAGISIGSDSLNRATITNSSPASAISVSAGTNMTVTGVNPSFTVSTTTTPTFSTVGITSASSTALSLSSGGGITLSGGNGSISLAGSGGITTSSGAISTSSGNITTGSSGYMRPAGGIQDSLSSLGSSGYILSSTSTAVKWIAPPVSVTGVLASTSTLTTSFTSYISASSSVTISTAQPSARITGSLYFVGTQPAITNTTLIPTVQFSYQIYRNGSSIGSAQTVSIPPVPISTTISTNTYYITIPITFIDTPSSGSYSYAVYCRYANSSTGSFSGTAPQILQNSSLIASVG